MVSFGQENRFDKLFEEADKEFTKEIKVESDFTVDPFLKYNRFRSVRTEMPRPTDVYLILDTRFRSPSIEVNIRLPRDNEPHYINKMMFKPPKVEVIRIER